MRRARGRARGGGRLCSGRGRSGARGGGGAGGVLNKNTRTAIIVASFFDDSGFGPVSDSNAFVGLL